MSSPPQYAFVTLVTSDYYLPGALVVAAALRDVHASPPAYQDEFDPSDFHRVCLVTPETVDVTTMKELRKAFDEVIGVEVIAADNEEGLALLGRLDLKTVLTKLHVFRLTSYRKIIFLDADILTLRPISHLFRITAPFAAVPDVGWPDIFNSGFFVLEPSEDKFKQVMGVMKSKGSWDGGDQGILNEWIGQDWERLSFTYNTTPTAAYTYAPAYKRFGSQISNIHFIGPNKPWMELSTRSPGTSSTSTASNPTQIFSPPPSYAFPALLDRWFAVYDEHYRSTPKDPEPDVASSYITPTSATGETFVHRYKNVWNSAEHSNVEPEASGPHAPLDLDVLRRLAIEGVGKSQTADAEGTYRSMPLEGRIDLMRPEKPQPEEKTDSSPRTVRIIVPESPHTPVRHLSHMTTLPTPGPNEFPPAPMFRGRSLPPETPTHARQYYLGTPDHEYSRHSPGVSSPLRPSSTTHSRPVSPPLLLWNAALEGPPKTMPPVSNFPQHSYFSNVWDHRGQHERPSEESGGFFPLPPPQAIPEELIKEGHYKNVIGEPIPEREQPEQPEQPKQQQPLEQLEQPEQPEQPQSEQPRPQEHMSPHEYRPQEAAHSLPPIDPSQPRPDRSKVGVVFPWEEKPRHAPKRFFPQADSPPPGQPFIQPLSPASKANVQFPPAHASPPDSTPPPHSKGFPQMSTYANVWDAVPSITRYAARLARPAPSLPILEKTQVAGRPRKGSAASAGGKEDWQEMMEVSSRDADADDEDDGDEEDEEQHAGESDGAPESVSVSASLRSPKMYRNKAVQTMLKPMKSQAVQTYTASVEPKGARIRMTHRAREKLSVAEKEKESPPAASQVPELSPLVTEIRTLSGSADGQARQIPSPASTLGPISPPEGVAVSSLPHSTPAHKYRPAGRAFDPARGLDVFKKGSEEVLARFLKMESWDDIDNAPGAGQTTNA